MPVGFPTIPQSVEVACTAVEESSAMRTFTLGSGTDRKLVGIEVNGPRLRVIQKKSDGTTKRNEKELRDEITARSEVERLVRDLISRGYVEQTPSGATKASPATAASKPASRVLRPAGGADEEPDDMAGSVLPRLGAAPGAGQTTEGAPQKKKTGSKKKKRKKADRGDGLDKRVIGAVVAVATLFVAGLGYIAYDTFLKPASIVGKWAGSMIEFEIGHPIIHTQYELLLDEKKNASLTLQEKFTSVGTYSVKGDRLKLTLKGEKGEDGTEGETTEREYKIALGSATLDLYDPASGKQVVQLIRFREKPVIGGGTPAPAAPKETEVSAVDTIDKAADDRLASVEFAPKDGAFKVRYPKGWEPDTGSRPDNTYSWVKFTRGSAKIQVHADITGSLMSGSAVPGQNEEGSELAPVHTAHTLYEKTAAEQYNDYKESKPVLFKGSNLGEGRISLFTGSSGGILGSTKLRGYHVTLLTGDRRVSALCDCPEKEFANLKPTFLAVCRSVSR
jgi:hypothetical protein